MSDTAARQVVEQWLENLFGHTALLDTVVGSRLTCHHPSGNSIIDAGRGSELRALFEPDAEAISRRQYFFLSQRDHVAVLGAATGRETQQESAQYWLQIFRLEGSRVAETWFSGF